MDRKLMKRIVKGMALVTAAAVIAIGGMTFTVHESGTQEKTGAYEVTASGTENDYGSSGVTYAKSYSTEEVMYAEASSADSGTNSTAKLIRTVSFTVRTKTYDAAYQALQDLIADCGGWVENLDCSGEAGVSLRRASFTLRIPKDNLEKFLNGKESVGGISSYSESCEDVSESYYDIQTRLTTQQEKLKRLQEMMSKAESVSDLIEIESAISDAQYYVDYYMGQLNSYDSRVESSYVYVTLRELSNVEAVDESKLPLTERMGDALRASVEEAVDFLQGTAVFLVYALPWAAGIGVIVLVIALIRKKSRKK